MVDDFAPTNDIEGASGAVCSSIDALRFGRQGVMGLGNA
jgi:hypothetical protein